MRMRHVGGLLALGLLVLGPASSLGIERHWNANFGVPNYSGVWDHSTAHWNPLPGGAGTQTNWQSGADAIFDAPATYTATVAESIDASSLRVRAGRVTFAGSLGVMCPTVRIDSGATLVSAGDRFLRGGVTALQLDGTLQLNQSPGTQRLVELSGGTTGMLHPGPTASASIRVTGNGQFDGSLSDFGSSRLGLLWNAGSSGTLTLGGDNSGMTGSVLLTLDGSILRLGGVNALGLRSYLRFEQPASARCFVELAGGDLRRVFAVGSNNEAGGGINSPSPAGFFATGADRKLEFVTSATSSTPALVVWGNHGLVSSTIALGHENSTHTLRWTNAIDLNSAARTIEVRDGLASIEAELPGNLSGVGASGLLKTGAGTLRLSGSNSYLGNTTIAAGTLRMDGTHTTAGNWTVQSGGKLSGSGTVNLATGRKLSALSGAIVAPGAGVGTLTVGGTVELLGGSTLRIELLGASAFDRLNNPTGTVALGGALEVSLLSGFEPAPTDRFEIVTATQVIGAFTNVNAFGLVEVVGGDGAFELDATSATSRVLTNFTRVGDVNRDGDVNNQDIASFVAVLTSGVPAVGPVGYASDVNRDGVVNNQDISAFVALLTGGRGTTEPLPAPLPEPTAVAGVACVLLASISRARRSRRSRA
jgi:autotransporter-associated beta strand protein